MWEAAFGSAACCEVIDAVKNLIGDLYHACRASVSLVCSRDAIRSSIDDSAYYLRRAARADTVDDAQTAARRLKTLKAALMIVTAPEPLQTSMMPPGMPGAPAMRTIPVNSALRSAGGGGVHRR